MVEILGAGRTIGGGFVVFDIAWDGDLTESRSVLWSMEVSSGDGTDAIDLGHLRVDGAFSSQFVDDQASGRRKEVAEDADLRDDEITVRFPENLVGVAVEWPVWRAVIALDGVPVASQLVALS